MNVNLREKNRVSMLGEIRRTAWKQIGEKGAASLSVRGVAREMGVSATSVYYYFKDRDGLVTALLIDAFSAFSQALETARNSRKPDDHAGRFQSMCKAYFTWAAQNPQRYALLFGTPIPGYLFAKELGPVAQRSFLILQGVIGEAHAAGKITGELALIRLPLPLNSQYEKLRKQGMPYAPFITHLALAVWSMMHGITSLYLQNYLTGFLQQDVQAFVDFEIEKLTRMLGLSTGKSVNENKK
jgi:AcrR family transcriptional regulator